nr:ATP-binding protein [Micromonospora sp. DSM 115978]
TVTDTGIGVPAEEQSKLFTRFYRGSTARQSAVPGTGLGLSLVAAIVHKHGGRVSLSSAADHGTTVTVRLPASSAS